MSKIKTVKTNPSIIKDMAIISYIIDEELKNKLKKLNGREYDFDEILSIISSVHSIVEDDL